MLETQCAKIKFIAAAPHGGQSVVILDLPGRNIVGLGKQQGVVCALAALIDTAVKMKVIKIEP